MLPTINKKFLLKLVVVVAVLAGGLVIAHTVQAGRIPDTLLAQADRAHALSADDPKKLDSAIGYLRQYLEFRPTDVDAMEKLGGWLRTRRKNGEPTDLLRLYDKILVADPNRHDTRREALKASLRIGRFTDAEAHAGVLTQAYPDEPQLWLDLGYARRGLQKHAEARECYEAALKIDPKLSMAYQEYAEYLVNEVKDRDQAKKVLDRLVAARPTDAAALASRGRFFAATESDAAAIVDARKALELDPMSADATLLLAEQLQKGKDIPAAVDLYKDGIKAHPTDARFVRGLAWLEVNRGNIGASVAALEDGMARVGERDAFDLLVPLADLLLQLRDSDRAKALIRKLEGLREVERSRQRTVQLQVLYLKGRLAMSESQWKEAIDLLSQLRAETGELLGLECQVNLLLSLCYQRTGDFGMEEQTLKTLLSKDPNHAAARVTLGTAYQNVGRFEEAIAEYEQAARSRFATAGTRATLLKMKAARLRATNADKRAWDELETQVRQFAPSFSGSDLAILRAELYTLRRTPDRAIAVLREEAMKRPTDGRLWAAYATAAADYAGVPAGLSLLDEAQAMCGDRPELRLARAALYARDPARLRPIDPLAQQIDTWPEVDQNKLLYGLIEIYDRIGDEAGVVRTFRRIAGRYPSDPAVWEGLFDRATRSGDAATATEARAMLAKLQSTEPAKSAAMLTAWEVANARRASDAPTAIEGLVKEFGPTPDRGDVCVALAKLRATAGDPGAAAPLFARAVQLDPVRFGPTQEYLAFLTAAGQNELLNRLLVRLTQDHRWGGEPVRRAVRQTVKRVAPAAAKRLLDAVRPAVELESDGLGWLGDCYAACGFTGDASACYDRATTTKVATSDDWLRKAVRTAEAGDADAAAKVLDDARGKLNSPQLYLMTAALFAEHPAANGWTPKGLSAADRKLYTQARLAVKLSKFDRDAAVSVLEDYTADQAVPDADRAWARRNLAMLLVARGTPTDRTRAKEMLTDTDKSPGDTADDKRSTAAVLVQLSQQLEGADRDQVLDRAIQVLAAVAKETNIPRDTFLLAQLYRTAAVRADAARAASSANKARELLQELIKKDPKNPEYYVAALDQMTEPADRELAERCAEFLIKSYRTDFRVVQAVSRFEVRAGRPENALAHAVAYSRTAGDAPGDLQARTARSAELLDELARKPGVRGTPVGRTMTDAAVEKYEGLFVSRPEAVVALVGLLSADGRAEAGFARVEKYATALPSRVKVLAGLAILRAGGATEAQAKKVGEWLEAALREEPGSAAVLMNAGEYHLLRRDVAEAERAYAAALEKDESNAVALSNLAWVLSPNPDAADRAIGLIERATRAVGLTGELLDTRSRVHIGRKDYAAAARDSEAALKQEATGLRLFHRALAEHLQGGGEAAGRRFREAKEKGLRAVNVHPADRDVFAEMEKKYGEGK
ncbi:MAG: tetratricopeptide repeat protein [Fimbriiglobus sp.]|nr:tetratricopeptide repeat protein [Fimbriiglobus sp.]